MPAAAAAGKVANPITAANSTTGTNGMGHIYLAQLAQKNKGRTGFVPALFSFLLYLKYIAFVSESACMNIF